LWSKSLPAASVTSPMVVQDSAGTDLVYVGDASGTFFAYNAVTGAKRCSVNLTGLRHRRAGRHVVVFGSKDTDDAVYSVNVSTGQMIWRHQTSTQPEQDVGGAAVISAPGVNGFADGAVYIEGKDGVVYALDLSTGAVLWSFTAGSPGLTASSGALAGNTLVIGSINGVYGLNATTGAMLWHSLSGIVVASPAVSGPAGTRSRSSAAPRATCSASPSPPGPSCGPRQERRPATTPLRPCPVGACSTLT
jgi:outer membrane protein assembly factor BamB